MASIIHFVLGACGYSSSGLFIQSFCPHIAYLFMQRIRIEDIRNDEWFKKGYDPVRLPEIEDVNLDDVNAVFDDPEVCKLQVFLSGLRKTTCVQHSRMSL